MITNTCSIYQFVYDHVAFLYMLIFWIFFTYERKHAAFVFLNLTYLFNMMSSSSIYILSNYSFILPMAE
jgi:hypothetical protein